MNFEQLKDEELIKKYQDGDEQVIDFILSRYNNIIHNVSGRYFLIGAEPEDLFQEGLIGLFKACQKFKLTNENSFKTFAYLCIERQVQSAIKSANRLKNSALNNSLSLNAQFELTLSNVDGLNEESVVKYMPSDEPTPEDILIEEETYLERLKQIKATLSDYEFKILIHYIKGYKYSYIANLIDKDFKSIDNALTRIKQKLSFLKNLK
ncbi:MAG: sigma-70 family RNA polymerase sigma factor [Clostridia bacterium]|nr:sigma-70 family RNA polymerase sigma factor [Clostridia bacterium]